MRSYYGPHGAFDHIARQAEITASAHAEAHGKAKDLEQRLDRLMLACEAMWTLLREKTDLTEEDLVNRINEIDLSDGKLDGKVRRTATTCPKCNRTLSPRFRQCMYCGETLPTTAFA